MFLQFNTHNQKSCENHPTFVSNNSIFGSFHFTHTFTTILPQQNVISAPRNDTQAELDDGWGINPAYSSPSDKNMRGCGITRHHIKSHQCFGVGLNTSMFQEEVSFGIRINELTVRSISCRLLLHFGHEYLQPQSIPERNYRFIRTSPLNINTLDLSRQHVNRNLWRSSNW